MFRKTLLSLGLGLALGTAQAGDIILVNPDAGGPDPVISVGSLGWNNGNAISIPIATPATPLVPIAGGCTPGTTCPIAPVPTLQGYLQTYGQGALANFNNALGNPIGGLSLNSNYEWTYTFGFAEEVIGVTTAGGLPGADFVVDSAVGNNFFRIYYDPAMNGNNLQGTGFNDGRLILSGTLCSFGDPGCPSGSGVSTFANSSNNGGALDQFTGNNYPGVLSTAGAGSSFIAARINFFDPAFFLTPPTVLQLAANTFQNDPYQQQNPSSCFWNGSAFIPGAGPGNFGGACLSGIGAHNGITGPDYMFQTRASTDFIARSVPEPGSLALLGMGLAGLAGFGRRRTRKAA